LLIQTWSEPDWEALPREYLTEPAGVKLFAPSLRSGQLLRFLLRANPTVTRRSEGLEAEARPKRRGLAGLDEQMAWLERQASKSGFELKGAMVQSSERWRVRRSGDYPALMTLQVVTYQGHLRIGDPEIFRSVLHLGIGHGKAFGLGLLSVAAASASLVAG
jgi:CRISPR system Cascade subunit CasE